MRAVILAGGRGSRLAPYTTVLPKPLMPIGDRAIIDVVVRQLTGAGFDHLTVAVGHLAHLIRAVIGDGTAHGVLIDYHEEDTPRGTAGPLATIDGLDETFLMLNGDVLTTLDYGELLTRAPRIRQRAHDRHASPRGAHRLRRPAHGRREPAASSYEEKPTLAYTVSMGVYALEPRVRAFVPADVPFDLPDLVQALLDAGEPVGAFPYDGYWLDIGRHDDYEQAIADFEELRPRLFSGD